jgi:hypothetical protein
MRCRQVRLRKAAWFASVALLSGCVATHRDSASAHSETSRPADSDPALCGARRQLLGSNGRHFRAVGKYSQSDDASFFEISECPGIGRFQVVDGLYTRGDASVSRLFQRLERACGAGDDAPCFVEADVEAIVTIRDDQGHPLLEFRHIDRAEIRRPF